jgi:hypothetical protein
MSLAPRLPVWLEKYRIMAAAAGGDFRKESPSVVSQVHMPRSSAFTGADMNGARIRIEVCDLEGRELAISTPCK